MECFSIRDEVRSVRDGWADLQEQLVAAGPTNLIVNPIIYFLGRGR
jgi:hypothetical protein